MDKSSIILKPGVNLKGKELTLAYRHFNLSKDLPESPAMFKKKEPLETMAKSILKHRIQSLTDKSVACIENEIGFNSPDGTGLTVEMLRRLAHFLILQASGELEQLPELVQKAPEMKQEISTPGKRKRRLNNDGNDCSAESMAEREPFNKKLKDNDSERMPASPAPRSTRATRKSLAPELLRKVSSKVDQSTSIGEASLEEENVACRLKASRKSNFSGSTKLKEESSSNDIAELNLGSNPTPQMIARKRRSLAITTKPVNNTPSKITEDSKNTVPDKSRRPTTPKKQANVSNTSMTYYSPRSSPETVSPPSIGYPGNSQNEIFLAQGDTSTLKYEDIKRQIHDFAGANLTVLHTPCKWGALEVFSLVMSIRQMNRKANVTTFSILVGCGLESIHLLHEALSRQTKHVQLVVFEREDKNLEQPSQFLRDVNSFFLLAYFFPDCEKEDQSRVVLPQLVRSGSTTCFRTKSSEDLENNIVHSLSEEGDWIIDLCCAGRELSLAAQKMGRNAIAIHDDSSCLVGLHDKASAIARHHDRNFRVGTDGVILKLN